MTRFLRELRYFLQEIRLGYPRQRDREQFHDAYRRLMSLELAPATESECFDAARTLSGGRVDWVAELYFQLRVRAGRDTRPNAITLATVVRRYKRVGSI